MQGPSTLADAAVAVHDGRMIAAVNLDEPGRYLHWSIFTVSVANLALICAMVLLFGAALLLPLPGTRRNRPGPGGNGPDGDGPDRAGRPTG
jgi:hypothetical protein